MMDDGGEAKSGQACWSGLRRPAWLARGLPVLLFVVLAALILLTFRDYGITWDEDAGQSYGQQLADWYSSLGRKDIATRSDFVRFYGGLVEIIAHVVQKNPPLKVFGPYEARHLVNAMFGILGIFFSYRLGRLLAGPSAGLTAAAFLTLTPVYYGHMFANAKDIPFAAMYVGGVYAICALRRQLPAVSWGTLTRAGLAIGLTLAVRIGGVFLFALLVLAVAITVLPGLRDQESQARWLNVLRPGSLLKIFAFVPALAWALMCVFWPFALVSPVRHPLEAIQTFSKYSWRGNLLFNGRVVDSHAVPLDYIPVWLAVSMPDFLLIVALVVVLGLVLGRFRQLAGQHWADTLLVLVAGLLPPLLIVVERATLYDGIRHVLFCLPPLITVLAVAFTSVVSGMKRALPKAAVLIAVGLGLLITAIDMVRLHPYQTVYFNRIVAGGLPGASGRFDTDYWGSSFKEGVQWVLKHVPVVEGRRVRVGNTCASYLTGYYIERDPAASRYFENVSMDEGKRGDVDIVLAITRDDGQKKVPGRVLYRVERFGVPLCYVIRVNPGQEF
jgi:hypothetical protein